MKGIELIQDATGQITGIKLDVQDDPKLAQGLYHLFRTLQKAKETEEIVKEETLIGGASKPMSLTALNKLVRDSKKSGEITQEEFFQLHPTWQKNEKLSLPN
ncbi:MAG: hypothetical protein AAF587_04455 [Bacteroidota bacterium]